MKHKGYPALAAYCREQTKANGVVLIAVDKKHGTSVTIEAEPILALSLPTILRTLADEMDGRRGYSALDGGDKAFADYVEHEVKTLIARSRLR